MKGAYQLATGQREEKEPNTSVEEDIAKVQAKIDWIQSTETQKLVQKLFSDSQLLVADAIKLSLVNHQQDNSKLIISKLLEANTLRKVVENYVTVK